MTQIIAAPGGAAMIELMPNTLYSASELEQMLGKRCLARLRKDGCLRAVGDRYLGRLVLDAYCNAAQAKDCQRVSGGKEVPNEAEHAKKPMEESLRRPKLQPLSRETSKN